MKSKRRTIEENTRRFEELLGSVQKEGIPKLMSYIRNSTDFYKAPASTRFHLACEGGLLQHSLNVYDCLVAKKENPIWKPRRYWRQIAKELQEDIDETYRISGKRGS